MAADVRLLALPGDGIGPEIMGATLKVLDAVRPQCSRTISVETRDIGFTALERTGSTIPQDVIAVARSVEGVLLGPVSHNAYPPREEGGLNPSGVLRRELDLFANIRPARRWVGVEAPIFKRATLGLETGIRYTGVPKSDNTNLGPGVAFAGSNNDASRWTVPVMLRGRYRF